jgi:chitinase
LNFTSSKRIIGYAYTASGIDASKLTHVNNAFGSISNNQISANSSNLAGLVGLKSQNPNLKVILSVGGWGANGFSDAALTDASRTTFTNSAINIIKSNKIDGIDLDWEFPTESQAGITARPEDKQNFTLLLAKLRQALDSQGTTDGKYYILSIAAGATQSYFNDVEINKIPQYLDYINIMTYDFHGSWDKTTAHHTNLYTPAGNPNDISIDKSVQLFLSNGVSADKINIGAAFYAHMWTNVTNANNGLFQAGTGSSTTPTYTDLVNKYINLNGYTRYWDDSAKAPYLFNGNTFITYDDSTSITNKTSYVKTKSLGGIFFWEYSQDNTGTLLNAMYNGLK